MQAITRNVIAGKRTIFINTKNLGAVATEKNSYSEKEFSNNSEYIRLQDNSSSIESFMCTDFSIGIDYSLYLPIDKFDESAISYYKINDSNNCVYIKKINKIKTILFVDDNIIGKIEKIQEKYVNLLEKIAYKKGIW